MSTTADGQLGQCFQHRIEKPWKTLEAFTTALQHFAPTDHSNSICAIHQVSGINRKTFYRLREEIHLKNVKSLGIKSKSSNQVGELLNSTR